MDNISMIIFIEITKLLKFTIFKARLLADSILTAACSIEEMSKLEPSILNLSNISFGKLIPCT